MCKSFMPRSLFQIIFELQFRPYLIFMTRYAKGYSQIIYWLIFRGQFHMHKSKDGLIMEKLSS